MVVPSSNPTGHHCPWWSLPVGPGGDHRRFRSLQLRYASPVIPGQTLVTEIWDLSSEELLGPKNHQTTRYSGYRWVQAVQYVISENSERLQGSIWSLWIRCN